MHSISYKTLPKHFYSELTRKSLPNPQMYIYNEDLSKDLDLKYKSDDWIDFFKNSENLEDFQPIAQAYAGHQFGHLTMLGDGRALLINEHKSKDGRIFDIQLKGGGRTPYSRGGDGKAALGPMLKEYLISESLHALGIPTTRSLAVIKTGERIVREKQEIGAILIRTASSHIRVGTFEYAASIGLVKTLADYTINRHFKHLLVEKNPYVEFLKEVIEKQAFLISKWQLVGFIHGVMNTDNMSICGESIDFGPCAFLEMYDPKTVFSSIDHYGRYRYDNQPSIGLWNLTKLASTLLPLLSEEVEEAIQIAQKTLERYWTSYEKYWIEGMARKLGINNYNQGDKSLILEWLSLLEKHKMDFTNSHYDLTLGKLEGLGFTTENDWHSRWYKRIQLNADGENEARKVMTINNPSIIPRNHIIDEALSSETFFKNYLRLLRNPFLHDENLSDFRKPTQGDYKTYCGT